MRTNYYPVELPFSLSKLLDSVSWCNENLGENSFIDIEEMREIRSRIKVPLFIDEYIENSQWCFYHCNGKLVFYFRQKGHAISFGMNFL